MTTELRGFWRTAAIIFAFGSFFATSFSLSAAMTTTNVAANTEFTFQSPNDRLNANTYELIVNAGSTTTVYLPPSGTFNCFVYLKGSGTVTFKKPAYTTYNGGDQVTFGGGIAADSTVTAVVNDVTTVNVGKANPANNINYPVVDVANMTFEQSGGKLVLSNKCTARALPSSFEVAPGANIALQGTNPLGLGSSFTLTDYDIVVLMRSAIPDGCTITVQPGRTLGLKPANTIARDGSTYKWNWSGAASYFDESFSISLGGKGARVVCRNTVNLRLFTPVTGVGEVVFWPDANSLASSSTLVFRGKTYTATYKAGSGVRDAYPVSIPVNTAAEPPPSEAWKSKVSHWFDASDATTIVPFSFDPNAAFGWSGAENKFNGNQIVIGWKDKVEGSGISFYNNRIWSNYPNFKGDYVLQVMPYLVDGGLNGKPYLSFGDYHKASVAGAKYDSNGNLVALTSSQYEDRRLWVWNDATPPGDTKPASGATTTFAPKYCIMVFGSQQGGGKSILGDAAGAANGDMARLNGRVTDVWTYYDSGCSMMVDGVGIAPQAVAPNGGWQIVTIDMTATNIVINGLGNHQNKTLYGGQNYAEIIFFDSAPTAAERVACEAYLAEKWGLKSTYSFRAGTETFSELSGGEGTTVTIGDYSTDDLTGSSTTYSTPEEVTIAGNYRGTIDIASGKTLVVSDRLAPPAPYDMPQQGNIVAWFDPSLAGAIDFTTSYPNGVARLYSRTASGVDTTDGAFWMGMNSSGGIGATSGRFPYLVETAYPSVSSLAPTMKWMDFTTNAVGDVMSNTLRSHTLPATDSDLTGTASTKMTFRSLFMAIDTSAGGGNPVFDEVGMNGAFKARAGFGEDYTQPIWNANNTVTMSHTWLDTNEVNGTTTGFNGRGEVLGFETSEDFTTHKGLFFGYYNPSHGNTNYEHIAESIIYSTTLADAERLTVQKYLMAKWFGDMNCGEFSDLSGATVTGAGNVKSASLRNLPAFDAGFTGSLSGGSDMTFTVNSLLNELAAVDAIAIDRAVTLDSACTVTVTLKERAKPGMYTLLTVPSGSLAGKTFALDFVNETGREAQAKLVVSDTTLTLEIASKGLVISIR